MSDKTISRVLENTLAGLSEIRESFIPTLQLEEAGWVESVGNGIARVKGLPGTGFEELLKFPDDLYGIAFNLEEEEIGVVLLGDYWHLRTGDPVERTGRVVEAPVGESLLGRVI
nr:F0F1 ATP synthase subunit alpha [Saprospiraceae bacterium]